MNKTGIIRKIDSLGRIVLPKELRYNLNIESGDDFEILLNDDSIVLKRYSKVINSKEYILNLINIFNSSLDYSIDVIVNNTYLSNGNSVDKELLKLVHERKIIYNNPFLENTNILYPIVINSDLICSIVCFGENETKEMEKICLILLKLIKEKIVEK